MQSIVSGGQTGADRAALDWAIQHNIPHGGWCPQGRRAEDGIIASRYTLKETPLPVFEQRTEWNVRDSDGTVIFSLAPELTGGTLLTLQCAENYHKPYLHLCKQESTLQRHVVDLLQFLHIHHIRILNIAGPRASTEPGIDLFVTEVLEKAYTDTEGNRTFP